MLLANTPAVPGLDPIGLPGHPLIFAGLLLLTQLLHLLFMNFVLGGNLIAVGLNIAGLCGHANSAAMARVFYKMLPVAISMTITTGVAPLLFVQVLYGPYFYSSTVLMGFGWFSFFVAVLVGFYLVYWLLFKTGVSPALTPLSGQEALQAGTARPVLRLVLSLLVTACLLWVGWVMANNHELSLRPTLWRAPGQTGSRWYIPATATLPRYLHDVVGATAIAGLWLAAVGWWRTRRARTAGVSAGVTISESRESSSAEASVSSSLIRLGLAVALLATLAQIGTGILLLLKLHPAVRSSLLAFNSFTGGVWMLSLLLIPVLFTLLAYASIRPRTFRWYALTVVVTLLLVVGMLFGREHVRLAHLGLPEAGAFSLGRWDVYPQYVSLAVFAVLLVAGLATVALMLKWILQGV
ncbi:MAG TPA: hypothetical protein PK184_19585 [Phycisphaerae bacterium]|nr:hypothetical protein [Phycisphaerae bacterium]